MNARRGGERERERTAAIGGLFISMVEAARFASSNLFSSSSWHQKPLLPSLPWSCCGLIYFLVRSFGVAQLQLPLPPPHVIQKWGGGEETANNGSCGGCRWHFPSCVYVLRAKARRSSYVFYYIGLNGLDEWVNFRIWRRGREESKKKKLAHILKFLFLPQPPTMEAQLEYAHFLHVWHQILHLQLVLIIAKKNSALELSRQFIKSALLVGCLLRLSSFPS